MTLNHLHDLAISAAIATGICLAKEAGDYPDFKLIDKERYEVVFSNNLL
jgi:hypothetical protein